MYRGTQIIPEARAFINALHAHQIPYVFLTNNAMRTPEENAAYMRDMGFEHIEPYMFYNSAMAAAAYACRLNLGRRAFMIGRQGLQQALEQAGFTLSEENPDFVFVGLDKEQDYTSYSKAVGLLLNGARLIGTNMDRVLVKPQGLELGNGSIVAMFEYCSGQTSPRIGKPSPVILDLCLEHYGLQKKDVVLVGDNLETDIALGYNSGVETIFVQTGVHTEKDLEHFHLHPDWVIASLDQLALEAFL